MIKLHRKSPPANADEGAIWWSARRRLGLLSPREEKDFSIWLENPANRLAWEATDDLLEAIGDAAAFPDVRAMRDLALETERRTPITRRRWTTWPSVAAALVAILVWVAQPFDRVSAPVTAHAPQRFTTQIGEQRNLVLSDGSRVTLDTSSVMEIAYRADRRDVRLLRGQAYFKVAKDTTRPFAVTAGDRRITATGTAFDVRVADNGTLTVLLVEGRVVVDPVKREGLARLIPSMARQELAPGEKLSISRAPSASATPKIAIADVVDATSWARGQLVFRDDLLSNAVTEMNRYSATKIVVEDERVGRIRISGVFGVEHGDNFIAAISSFYPIDAERRSPNMIILNWRESAAVDRLEKSKN